MTAPKPWESAPKCPDPDCGATCGTENGESIDPGDLRCACCGKDWTATTEELEHARASDAAWETEQQRREARAMTTKHTTLDLQARTARKRAQLQLVVLSPILAMAIALLSGCTPIARAQTALALADTSGAIGCSAEAAGESWGAPLCRAAEWLAGFALRRVDRLTTRAERKAAAELEAAVEACDPEPTPEQLAAVVLAQASCDLEGPVVP